ncbi:MAG: ATP12 family protein [Hyphomicrobiales bacterium]|nr:ATP12 family protein [Hyphomicrobiales bacterium]
MNDKADTPVERARRAARAPLRRRFYDRARAAKTKSGFHVLLDGSPIQTPARTPLVLPARALAEAIAAEWQVQGTNIDPAALPLTRLAFTVIDRVARAREAVIDALVAYAGSDLVCYRAEEPEGLIARQRQAWDPVLAWAAEQGLELVTVAGLTPRAQPRKALDGFREQIEIESDFILGALADMTGLMGSALLALAVLRRRLSAEEAWAAAHVDEDWQIAQWGEDAEAAQRRRARWCDMQAAARLAALVVGEA